MSSVGQASEPMVACTDFRAVHTVLQNYLDVPSPFESSPLSSPPGLSSPNNFYLSASSVYYQNASMPANYSLLLYCPTHSLVWLDRYPNNRYGHSQDAETSSLNFNLSSTMLNSHYSASESPKPCFLFCLLVNFVCSAFKHGQSISHDLERSQ